MTVRIKHPLENRFQDLYVRSLDFAQAVSKYKYRDARETYNNELYTVHGLNKREKYEIERKIVWMQKGACRSAYLERLARGLEY